MAIVTAGFAQDAARMAEILRAHAAGDRFMGSVLVAKDGRILFEQSCGWANAEWKIPNTATTKFRLGSVTKQFTAAAILLLAEQGKLQLDDPLSKFVPSAPESWRPVTLRQLLSHTAGVPGFTDHPDYRTLKLSPQTPAQVMAHIAHLPLEFTPGEKFKYSNMGYILLGWIVELASGQTYEAFLRQHIFQPLGMNDSGYDLNATVIPERASGYMLRPGGLANAPYIDMHVPGGAGALYSTTRDLLRWSEGLFGGKLLSAASLEQMTTPVKNGYAFGLGVNTVKGRKVISHNGGIEGFNSQVTYYPENKLTVIVLANIMGSPFTEIARDLAAIAFGENVTLVAERKSIDVPEAGLRRYVGVYQMGRGTNTVRLTDGHLTTQLTGQSAFPLWPESETKFFLKVVDAQVEFFADDSGRVTHLVLYQNGRELKAERISDSVPELAASASPSTAAAGERSGDDGRRKSGGSRISFPNMDIARVAQAWERMFGTVVTVNERAKSRRVSIDVSAPSRDELRPKLVAALRENGIYVIEKGDAVVFDTEPGSAK